MGKKQEIIIIAAVSENDIIGKGNEIPWKIKEDLRRFKELTSGWPCIMGRKTYESLPIKPLPNRRNIVVSRRPEYRPVGAIVFPSLPEAIDHCKNYDKVYICGGSTVYEQVLPFANRIELTRIHKTVDGDIFFPPMDLSEWRMCGTVEYQDFSFISYIRNT